MPPPTQAPDVTGLGVKKHIQTAQRGLEPGGRDTSPAPAFYVFRQTPRTPESAASLFFKQYFKQIGGKPCR
jgi:hypothetical protein